MASETVEIPRIKIEKLLRLLGELREILKGGDSE